MSAMVAAHTEVPDTAPLNASLVRDRVDAAAKLGVVWSPALFAVLDDISRPKEQ